MIRKLDTVKDNISTIFVTKGDTFVIDIGSNLGLYSLAAASMGKDVWAFEPFKKNQNRFCASIVKNGFGG